MSFWDDAWNGVKAVANVVTGGVTGAIDAAVTGVGSALNGLSSPGAAAGLNLAGGYLTGASAEALQRETNAAMAAEAEKNRQFQQGAQQQAQGFNAQQAQMDRMFQAQQAIQAREYATQMSNSAYQRASADMKAAGINPMLAIMQGGASTPNVGAPQGVSASSPGVSGAQASFHSPTAGAEIMSRKIAEAVSSARESKALQLEWKYKDSQIAFNKAATEKEEAIKNYNNMNSAKVASEIKRLGMENVILSSQLPAMLKESKIRKMNADFEYDPWTMSVRKLESFIPGFPREYKH